MGAFHVTQKLSNVCQRDLEKKKFRSAKYKRLDRKDIT